MPSLRLHNPVRQLLTTGIAVALSASLAGSSMAGTTSSPPISAVPIDTPLPSATLTWLKSPPTQLDADVTATFEAQIASPVPLRVQNALINVRNESDEAFPVGIVKNVTISPRGLVLRGTRTLPPGRYRYRAGYSLDGRWHNVGDIRAFTVTRPRKNWVVGYYVGYLKGRYPLAAINWEALTHIAVGAVIPRTDGSLESSFFQDQIEGPVWAKSVVRAAHEKRRQAILMVGGAGFRDGFLGAIQEGVRDRFTENLLAIVDSFGFDGLDLDFEPLQESDGPAFLALAKEIRARRPSLTLTVPVGAVNTNIPQATLLSYVGQLPRYFDQVNIMSYGMNGAWRGWSPWHSSALSGATVNTPTSLESSVNGYLSAGVPAEKLGLGIGMYGTCYKGVTDPGPTTLSWQMVGDDHDMSYANIVTQYRKAGVRKWDSRAAVPYLSNAKPFGPLGCSFVPYEDPQSVALKGQYAKDRGLGGAIIWNINEGLLPSDGSPDPMLSAIANAFKR